MSPKARILEALRSVFGQKVPSPLVALCGDYCEWTAYLERGDVLDVCDTSGRWLSCTVLDRVLAPTSTPFRMIEQQRAHCPPVKPTWVGRDLRLRTIIERLGSPVAAGEPSGVHRSQQSAGSEVPIPASSGLPDGSRFEHVLVRYVGWGSRWDEWLWCDSRNLRLAGPGEKTRRRPDAGSRIVLLCAGRCTDRDEHESRTVTGLADKAIRHVLEATPKLDPADVDGPGPGSSNLGPVLWRCDMVGLGDPQAFHPLSCVHSRQAGFSGDVADATYVLSA